MQPAQKFIARVFAVKCRIYSVCSKIIARDFDVQIIIIMSLYGNFSLLIEAEDENL